MAKEVEIGKIVRSPKTITYSGVCDNCNENKKLVATGLPANGKIRGYKRYCEDCAVLLRI